MFQHAFSFSVILVKEILGTTRPLSIEERFVVSSTQWQQIRRFFSDMGFPRCLLDG